MVLKIPFFFIKKKKKVFLQNIKKRQLWRSFKFLKNNLSIFSEKNPKNNKAHFNFNEPNYLSKKKKINKEKSDFQPEIFFLTKLSFLF